MNSSSLAVFTVVLLATLCVLLSPVSGRGALSETTYRCDLPGEEILSCECLTENLSERERTCDNNLCFVKKFTCGIDGQATRTVDNTSGEYGKN